MLSLAQDSFLFGVLRLSRRTKNLDLTPLASSTSRSVTVALTSALVKWSLSLAKASLVQSVKIKRENTESVLS